MRTLRNASLTFLRAGSRVNNSGLHFFRGLSSTCVRQTDGVYPELTAMRVRIPWIEALRKKQLEVKEGVKPLSSTPAQRDLTPKTMSSTFHRVVLPLAQDPWLLDNYSNSDGRIRLGTLLMDLDALSGVIAYKQTGDHVMTVTAAVDRIVIKHPLDEICDLEISGHVSFATGRSSMEISMQVAKAPPENQKPKPEDVLITCAFTMVSLDPATKKPIPIPPLKIETPEEQKIFDLGQKNYEAKKALSRTALRKMTPNDEESDLIHSMWLKQLDYHDPNNPITKPSNMVYMEQTRIHSTQIMQPQFRNRHNFMIFGGFLLKHSFELAFCCAAAFSHTRPTFVNLDPSTFENPVPVGSVLYLTATVAYTAAHTSSESSGKEKKQTMVQVRVDSKVRNVEHGEVKPTGQFNYTFLVNNDVQIMPKSYSEFMVWTDARRRAMKVREDMEMESAARTLNQESTEGRLTE